MQRFRAAIDMSGDTVYLTDADDALRRRQRDRLPPLGLHAPAVDHGAEGLTIKPFDEVKAMFDRVSRAHRGHRRRTGRPIARRQSLDQRSSRRAPASGRSLDDRDDLARHHRAAAPGAAAGAAAQRDALLAQTGAKRAVPRR
jgi:hypothetical protein